MTALGSRSPIAASAPAQKTLPITAASASSDFTSGSSVSRRAAISACTESGNGTSAPSRSRQLEPSCDEQVAVLQQAHELLREERVATGALEDRLLQLGRQHRRLEQAGDELAPSLLRERREVDGGRVRRPAA